MTDPLLNLASNAMGELARRGHREAALRLISAWGGTRHYIPCNPTKDSPLVILIGEPAAMVLAELIGGDYFDIPAKGVLDKLGKSMKERILQEDGPVLEVAQKLGTSQCYVRRIRRLTGWRKPANDA